MAGKRSATSELNHENWDQDEELEEAGSFQRASDESLKRRIIKTARRRNPISSVRSDPDKKSAFTGFTAFSKTSPPTTSTFSFLSNITNQTQKLESNGTSVVTEKSGTGNDNAISVTTSSNKPVLPNIKKTNGNSNDYLSKLKGLNESVANWIKKHVDANPLINLQPIFKDYEKYFKELEKEDSKSHLQTKNTDLKKNDEKVSILSTFVFKPAENIPDSTTGKAQLELDKTGNTSNSTSTMSTLTPSFSFGSKTSTSGSSGFSFSGSTPFTFSNVVQPSSTKTSNKEEDAEEDEPPKVKFTPVIEKDYIFSTRCKVFVKKPDGNYGDRGVGNLYLKNIENSNKVQLIVRADTNLGNLLCNFILSECIPIKRIGKKDVMLVCLPTPDEKPPPLPILLRVKSPEEADNLFQVLEKHKK